MFKRCKSAILIASLMDNTGGKCAVKFNFPVKLKAKREGAGRV